MKKSTLFLIAVAILFLLIVGDVSPLAAQDVATDPAVNKALLTEWWQVEAEHDYTHLDDFFTTDFVRHSVATSAVMPDMRITNLDEYAQFLESTAAMFPDYHMTPQMLSADGDYVAFYSTFSGTFVQNGNRVEIPMVGFARFEGGKIAELWVEWDNLTWNAQMTAEAVEAPISGIEDVVGVWNIEIQSTPFQMKLLPDGTGMIVNPQGAGGLHDTSCPECEERFTYIVEDNQLHFLTSQLHPNLGDVRYDVFMTKQGDHLASLRFGSVGFDSMNERRIALDGQTLFPAAS